MNISDDLGRRLPPELALMDRLMKEGKSAYEIGYAVTESLYSGETPENLAILQATMDHIRVTEGEDDYVRGSQAWLDSYKAGQ